LRPSRIKTIGYLISSASVLLLGIAAWPGARDAGLVPVLIGGMATSALGMAFRWRSYELEKAGEPEARDPPERR